MDEAQRNTTILQQQGDERIIAFLTEVSTTRQTLETTRVELEASNQYTPDGIEARLTELRTTERERLSSTASFLSDRTTNLEKAMKRDAPTEPEPLLPEQNAALLAA